MADVEPGAEWIQAPSEGQRVPGWVSQPRFRLAGSSLVAQHPPYDQVYPGFLVFWGVVWTFIEAGSDPHPRVWIVLVGAVATILGLVGLQRARRVTTVIDPSGWHGPQGLLARDAIEQVVIFRGGDRRADFVRTLDGERFPIGAMLPGPWTRGMEVPPEGIDLFCRLQHELAHRVGCGIRSRCAWTSGPARSLRSSSSAARRARARTLADEAEGR